MSQQQTRHHGRDEDEESEDVWPAKVSRNNDSDSDSDRDSGYGSGYDDDLLEDIDRLLDGAAVWEQFVQKGGE